jgi:hypothetical protein
MALTAASMMAKVKAAIAAVPAQQFDSAGDPSSYRDAILLAMCQGIIDEIQANAEVPVTAGSSAGIYQVT